MTDPIEPYQDLWLQARTDLSAGNLEAAAQAYQKLAAALPDDPRVNMAYAFLLQQQGQLEEALDHLMKCARVAPNALTLTATGDCLVRLERFPEALNAYRAALTLAPDNSEAALCLATTADEMNDAATAMEGYSLALADPVRRPFALTAACNFLIRLQTQGWDPRIADFFTQVASLPECNPKPLRSAAQKLLLLSPDLQALNTDQPISDELLIRLSDTPLFMIFLQKVPFSDPQLEKGLFRLRSHFLTRYLESADLNTHLPLILGLADQCFLNEYAYHLPEHEAGELEELLTSLNPADPDPVALALISCFKPLMDWPEPVSLLHQEELAKAPAFAQFLNRHIREPLEELEIAGSLERIGRIAQATSQQVQAQYEESPYPRWQDVGRGKPVPFPDSLRQQLPNHHLPGEAAQVTAPQMLLAGCGTGQQCVLAADSIQDAKITAIDLSSRSLAYAIRKARHAGISNIRFYQADILELGSWDQRFDIIESTGVLHHMQDPMKGWRILVDLLKPGGFMKIGLYSRKARDAVTAAQIYAREQGFGSDLDGIRAYRKHILDLPLDHPQREITRSTDFYPLSACRDLVFHVQEHQYDIPDLDLCLRELGLKFIGFQFPKGWQTKKFREMYPDDIHLSDLQAWDAFETAYPKAFGSMYVFWCQKPV